MNQSLKYFILLLFGISMSFNGTAQRDTISTDKLIIIKQYSPTVNDAFKIKQKPSEKDTIKQTRQPVSYSFIDVPVASTFTPAKGTASGVRMSAPQKLYENYARFGAGNYSTIQADFYSNFELNNVRSIDIGFSHLSSQGGIDDVVLDDDFSDTSLDIKLTSKDRYFEWNTGIDLNHREINYYGLPETYTSSLTQEEVNSIEPIQTYTKLEAFGEILFYDNILKKAKLNVQNFSDDYNSSEQFLNIESLLEIPVRYQTLSLKGDFSILNGVFDTSFYDLNEVNFQQFQAGLNPFIDLDYENLSVKLGAKAVFFNDFEESSSEVFFYPDVDAEFFLNNNSIKINVGLGGDLEMNTFENFSNNNPFVSPTLLVKPSDNKYNAYASFSSKLLDNLSLSAKARYSSTNDFAFFRANPDLENNSVAPTKRNFDYQNSFDVTYNDLDIFSISADLSYQIESDLTLGFFGKYSNFSTEQGQEAWNLPEVELESYANYNFTKNWSFSASLFYVGERKDSMENVLIASNNLPISSGSTITTVDGFLDVNASVEYKIMPRLSAFVNANNLLNNSYNRWQNYEVQGLQILGGLIYQFDW